MKILGIIPARAGSKGVLKKNIKLLNNKPLIAYTIEAALNSNLSRVIVSTDCKGIAKVSESYGAEVFMRPSELAKDDTPTLPVLQNVVSRLDEQYDAVMTLQPTSPLRDEVHINDALSLFKKNPNADSLVSVVHVPHNFLPEKLMRLNKDGLYLSIEGKVKRRQDMPTLYARNGAAIYITRTKRIQEYVFGGLILPFFMEKVNSFDIDDMQDWNIVEYVLRSLNKK